MHTYLYAESAVPEEALGAKVMSGAPAKDEQEGSLLSTSLLCAMRASARRPVSGQAAATASAAVSTATAAATAAANAAANAGSRLVSRLQCGMLAHADSAPAQEVVAALGEPQPGRQAPGLSTSPADSQWSLATVDPLFLNLFSACRSVAAAHLARPQSSAAPRGRGSTARPLTGSSPQVSSAHVSSTTNCQFEGGRIQSAYMQEGSQQLTGAEGTFFVGFTLSGQAGPQGANPTPQGTLATASCSHCAVSPNSAMDANTAAGMFSGSLWTSLLVNSHAGPPIPGDPGTKSGVPSFDRSYTGAWEARRR